MKPLRYVIVGVLAVAVVLSGCELLGEEEDLYDGPTDTVTGVVYDATTGSTVASVTVSVSGYPQFDTQSSAFGSFSIVTPTGTQTLVFSSSSYVFPPLEVSVVANATIAIDAGAAVGSPTVSGDGIRIVLTWGERPYDLDSHLLTPGGQHVYYGNRTPSGAGANLDRDDTSSYGPETITITELQAGSYTYYVYNFSGSPALTESSGVVRVYDSSGLVRTFNVPTSGTGLYWHVMTLNATAGGSYTITDVNSLMSVAPTN